VKILNDEVLIRFFDILLSFAGLLVLFPLLIVIALLIFIDSRGGIFYVQIRVGKNGKDFRLIKFRTMASGAEKHGGLTVGARDSRITRIGFFLRTLKLDELPQLINVLKGEMSLVGPRPEIRKYVDCYTPEQRIILTVRPGITDHASIEFISENEILGRSPDPEKTYIEEVMPAKILLNMRYIENQGLGEYGKILLLTFASLFRPTKNVTRDKNRDA
jgi:lipopolysaccharide/colanic/teichoic acid biosynthesis glycosyltransferase